MKRSVKAGIFLGAVAVTLLSGCRVDSRKHGDNEDVKIATPFGGLSVKTDNSVVQAGVGLSVYPGAVLVKKDHESGSDSKPESGAADINMSFGSFHLGVKALSYQTPDPPEKVIAFYRKDMARYGQVIYCRGHQPVGTPTETQDGLTCADSNKNIHVNGSGAQEGVDGELKTGSKLHQRLVAIDPVGNGTKFGLVMLDLPGHMNLGDSKDSRE